MRLIKTRIFARTFSRTAQSIGDGGGDGADKLLGDQAERLVAQHGDGAVVHLQCIIERDLILI
jgi:hypothetical protein